MILLVTLQKIFGNMTLFWISGPGNPTLEGMPVNMRQALVSGTKDISAQAMTQLFIPEKIFGSTIKLQIAGYNGRTLQEPHGRELPDFP